MKFKVKLRILDKANELIDSRIGRQPKRCTERFSKCRRLPLSPHFNELARKVSE